MMLSQILRFALLLVTVGTSVQDDSWVKDPSMCEVCKFLATELKERLEETGKSKEVLETGHGLDDRNKKRFKYKTSELRLTEALQDPHICDKIVEYNVHAEREGSNRYAKGMSETMKTLHGLKDKGVKVELGIPEEMWDAPSAEVTRMQRKCYHLVEEHEEDVEDWYFHHQDSDIMEYLCRGRVLKTDDQKCLDEIYIPKEDDEDAETSKKGDTGDSSSSKSKGKKKPDKKKKEDGSSREEEDKSNPKKDKKVEL